MSAVALSSSSSSLEAFAPELLLSETKHKHQLPSFQQKRGYCMSSNPRNEQEKAIAAATEQANKNEEVAAPTLFEKIARGEIPSKKIFEDDQVYAFHDISPTAPVHFLVVPKQCKNLTQLSKATEEDKGLLGHLLYVAGQLGQEHCHEGFRLVINDGKNGCQSVYHLHVHVVGGKQLSWPPGTN